METLLININTVVFARPLMIAHPSSNPSRFITGRRKESRILCLDYVIIIWENITLKSMYDQTLSIISASLMTTHS